MTSNPRKYTDEQIAMMERMKAERMSYTKIGRVFNTDRYDIERQLKSFGSVQDATTKGLPVITTWDFSKENL